MSDTTEHDRDNCAACKDSVRRLLQAVRKRELTRERFGQVTRRG